MTISSPSPFGNPEPPSPVGPAQSRDAFVGRARELSGLRRMFDSARNGSGGMALLVGEPGIGKTRIAQIITTEASAAGATILWGRGFEGEWSPPYGPWVAALSELLSHLSTDQRAATIEHLGPAASILGRILPEVAETDAPPSTPLDPEEERFRLHEAVAHLLIDASTTTPLVIVLDDLQWADGASLALLRHVVRVLARASIMIVATLRDAELDRAGQSEALTALLAALHREANFLRLPLIGLAQDEVGEILAKAAAHPISAELGAAIHGETGGNPFYVQEIIRHLLEEGRLTDSDGVLTTVASFRDLGVPEGVRQVVNRRLARLSEPAQGLLGVASVFTAGAEVQTLHALSGLPEPALLDAIDEALAAGLLRPVPGRDERYDFTHAIIRQALYEERSPSRRVRLHRQVAEAMERLHGSRSREYAAELAAQYHASASLPGAVLGVPHALVAAETARARYAREQSAHFLRMARDLATEADAETRADVLARLAVAEAEALLLDSAARTTADVLTAFAQAGRPPEAEAEFLERIAFTLKSSGADAGVWRPLVDRGLELAAQERGLTWARLSLIHDPIEPVANTPLKSAIWRGFEPDAVAIARAEGGEEDYARTLESFDPRTRAETNELIVLGRRWQQPGARMRALTVAANDLQYRHGAFDEAISLWEELRGLSEREGAISWQSNALMQLTFLHLTRGEFSRARAAEQAANALLTRFGPYRESDVLATEMMTSFAWYLEGDWPRLAAFWSRFVAGPAFASNDFSLLAGPLYAAMAALAHICAGEEGKAEARRLLDTITPLLVRIAPELGNQNTNGAVGFGAAAAWRLGAVEYAASYRRLAEMLIADGVGDYPQTSLHLTLARMAALRGDLAEALIQFGEARRRLADSGQRPLSAIVDYDEALTLLRARTDLRHAGDLLESAHDAFFEMGMDGWRQKVEAAQADLTATPEERTLPAGLTEREVDVLRLVGRGYSDRQISEELFISTRTVNAHLRNMFAKADVNNRTELSVWAAAHGLLGESSDDHARRGG